MRNLRRFPMLLASHAQFSTISTMLFRNESFPKEKQQPICGCHSFSDLKWQCLLNVSKNTIYRRKLTNMFFFFAKVSFPKNDYSGRTKNTTPHHPPHTTTCQTVLQRQILTQVNTSPFPRACQTCGIETLLLLAHGQAAWLRCPARCSREPNTAAERKIVQCWHPAIVALFAGVPPRRPLRTWRPAGRPRDRFLAGFGVWSDDWKKKKRNKMKKMK